MNTNKSQPQWRKITPDCQPQFPWALFAARYQPFPDGRIWSRRGFRWLKVHYSKSGYANVSLDLPGIKTFRLHRIIAMAFIPNPDNKPEVNHRDGNKANNTDSNLEWVTHRENCDHARDVLGKSGQFPPGVNNSPDSILTESIVRDIRKRFEAGEAPVSIARALGLTRSTVGRVTRKETWRNVA